MRDKLKKVRIDGYFLQKFFYINRMDKIFNTYQYNSVSYDTVQLQKTTSSKMQINQHVSMLHEGVLYCRTFGLDCIGLS